MAIKVDGRYYVIRDGAVFGPGHPARLDDQFEEVALSPARLHFGHLNQAFRSASHVLSPSLLHYDEDDAWADADACGCLPCREFTVQPWEGLSDGT